MSEPKTQLAGVVAEDAEEPHRPIVVGVDGSASSKGALRWAARQAELTQSPLHVVVAWCYPTAQGWMPPMPPEFDPEKDARAVGDQAVEEVLGPEPAVDVDVIVAESHPSPLLVELSAGAGLVVVGSRGHGAFAGMLLGSVSEFLATHARCPVVVVR